MRAASHLKTLQIVAIAIACVDASPDSSLEQKLPCGACLQWLQELATDAAIFIMGEQRSFRLQDLLPHAFTLAP
jgi:cytidine deaminase